MKIAYYIKKGSPYLEYWDSKNTKTYKVCSLQVAKRIIKESGIEQRLEIVKWLKNFCSNY